MSKKSSVRATFDSEQKYDEFVKDLENRPIVPLGELKIELDTASYNPGTIVTITCEEKDVQSIRIIILKYGKHVI